MRPLLTLLLLLCAGVAAARQRGYPAGQAPQERQGGRAPRPPGNSPTWARRRGRRSRSAEALTDRDTDVRRYATYALGQVGKDAKPAVKALTERLKDKEEVQARRRRAGQDRPRGSEATPALIER
jgi:hypothetical protein